MNLRGIRSRDDPEINFIPLIDVLLVILIFLMVTTTYQRVAELQITLPEADAEQMKQRPKEINVGVDAQGRYVIDRTVFNFTSVSALAEAMKHGRRRCEGSGRHRQRRRQRDASVRDPRDGSRAGGGIDSHHLRHADAEQVTSLAQGNARFAPSSASARVDRRIAGPCDSPTVSSPPGIAADSRR